MRKNLKEARRKAGMTQQQMADKLDVGLRHYQKIESGDSNGSFEVWDALEDILGIHQRILREIEDTRPCQGENPSEHSKNRQG
jgi:DNA-binding XRE family transcriptional regulator